MKKAIYTAIIGPYDDWIDPDHVQEGFDYFLFTDQKIESNVYKVIQVGRSGILKRQNIKRARYYKINSQEVLKDYEYTVWHDANICLNNKLNAFLDHEHDFQCLQHPERKNILQEAKRCIELKKDDKSIIEHQINYYKREFKRDLSSSGLWATGLLFRRNTHRVRWLNIRWWHDVRDFSIRDQLSLPMVKDQPFSELPFNLLNTYFPKRRHK